LAASRQPDVSLSHINAVEWLNLGLEIKLVHCPSEKLGRIAVARTAHAARGDFNTKSVQVLAGFTGE
jgi:hypothetical protein